MKKQNKKFLVIDDELFVAESLKNFLRRHGFGVDISHLYEDALKKVEENKYDVILLDINLNSDNDGLDILKKVKEINPETIVIVVTGYDTGENITRAKELNADAFLHKPLMTETLEKFILSTIERLQEERKQGKS